MICISTIGFSQNDKNRFTSFTTFKDKIVAYSDIGFTSSPYTIKFKSNTTDVDKLKFKNNHGLALGFGISYKWFSLRIAFPVIRNIKPIDQFGKTRFIDIGLDFPIKKMYFELDFRNYTGYSIKNASDWNKKLPLGQKHEIRPNASTLTIALNGWYFFNKEFQMNSLKGKVGHYNKEVFTWYLKNSVNIQGVSDVESIIPLQLTDSLTTKNRATTISAFDFGSIPGFAYVNKTNNWQYAGMIGFGPVIQSKFYIVNEVTRGFLGLAPRYDIRFIGGYNVPRWFVMLSAEFDNKSTRFNNLIYRNYNYTIKLVGGIRLDKKKNSNEKSLINQQKHA